MALKLAWDRETVGGLRNGLFTDRNGDRAFLVVMRKQGLLRAPGRVVRLRQFS